VLVECPRRFKGLPEWLPHFNKKSPLSTGKLVFKELLGPGRRFDSRLHHQKEVVLFGDRNPRAIHGLRHSEAGTRPSAERFGFMHTGASKVAPNGADLRRTSS
jgi:hypothetical protein